MDAWSAAVLGLVQGLSEFLPVSSSGHLILAREFLGLPMENGLAFDAMLHLATALAVILYFWKDLLGLILGLAHKERQSVTLVSALILGTIPAAVAGYFLESTMDTVFRSPVLVAGALVAGSIVFIVAERLARMDKPLSLGRGFGVGLFQIVALIPGMSRSGMTISGGLILGLTREQATRFAFLLSFPVILGAGAKKILELSHSGALDTNALPIVIGALVAFASGLGAIHFMIRFVRTHTLIPFVIYRVALAALVLALFM